MSLSPERKILAVGLMNGDIRFYGYPVISSNPVYTKYMVHSSPVMKIVFCDTNKHMISIGRDDRCVSQWKYEPFDLGDKGINPKAESLDKSEEYFNYLKTAFVPDPLPLKPEEIIKSYVSEVKVREDIKFPSRQGEAPDQNLELKHIFGCKYEGVTNFAKFSASNAVIFFSGNKGIVKDPLKDSKNQSFFTKHKNDIQCMDIHKNKEWIATGENAKPEDHAHIYIWTFDSKIVQASMKTGGKGGVIKLKFSNEGSRLLSVSNDSLHTIDIFDVNNSRLLNSVSTEGRAILDLSFKSEFEFASITASNIRFWDIKGANLVGVKGNWLSYTGVEKTDREDQGKKLDKEPEALVSCIFAFLQNICFTGTRGGNIYTWQQGAF